MATRKELVNEVLRRLREPELGTDSTIASSTYATMVASFLNDIKTECEDAWNWGQFRETIQFDTESGTSLYSLPNTTVRTKLLSMWNTTQNSRMRQVTEDYFNRSTLIGTQSNAGPSFYIDRGINAATEYNDALLIVENNSIGWAAIQVAIDREYRNLFYTSKDLHYVDVQNQITNRYRTTEKNMVAGFSMTQKTRPLVIDKLDEYFREKSVTVRSNRLIDELFVFIYKTGIVNAKAEAMDGYNDDLVMSLSIGLWVRDTALRLRTEGVTMQKKALNGIGMADPVYTADDNENDSWQWNTGKKEKEDLTWLIK